MQGSQDEITGQVRNAFAELTRYPLEVLELDADLEQDLGIDSVKLNEVLAALRERYGLAQRLDAGPNDTRTIRALGSLVSRALSTATPTAAARAPSPVRTESRAENKPAPTRARDAASFLEPITQTFVELTRYPREVLEADADLEQDLGIDSVKLNEVLAALREQHGLSERMEPGNGETRTIRGIATLLARTLSSVEARGSTRAQDKAGAFKAEVARAEPVIEAPAPEKRRESARVSVLGEVFTVFAELTRYPLDVLEPDSDLEQDLGIDSVKLNEVLAALRERFQLPPSLEVRTDKLRTIRAIAELIATHARTENVPQVARHQDSVIPRAMPAAVRGAAKPAPQDHVQASAELQGKVILVTGSGHGLGLTTARMLAKRGARVVVNSFHSRAKGDEAVAAIRSEGGQAEHVWGSVAKPDHVERMFQEVEQRMGGLDFFVSNASNGHLGPAEEIGVEHWEKAFRTNVMGFHLCAIAAARLMAKRGGGSIVSMSCTGASRYLDHFACLGAVKGAVESLTRTLAVELGPKNVRVNCVSAGPIHGALLGVYPERERLIPYWEARTPTGRLCTEEEVADVVLFLLSRASRQVNGTVMTVDGGGSLRI